MASKRRKTSRRELEILNRRPVVIIGKTKSKIPPVTVMKQPDKDMEQIIIEENLEHATRDVQNKNAYQHYEDNMAIYTDTYKKMMRHISALYHAINNNESFQTVINTSTNIQNSRAINRDLNFIFHEYTTLLTVVPEFNDISNFNIFIANFIYDILDDVERMDPYTNVNNIHARLEHLLHIIKNKTHYVYDDQNINIHP